MSEEGWIKYADIGNMPYSDGAKKMIEYLDDYLNHTDLSEKKEEYRKEFLSKLLEGNANDLGRVTTVLEKYPEFYTSPASAKYHGSYDGGLFDHSVGVLLAALKCAPIYGINLASDFDIVPVLFHDLCKVGFYIRAQKTKKENGKWIGYYGYDYNNDMSQIQHGPESLRRLLPLVYISEPWQLAIAYHMGVFDAGADEKAKFSRQCELHPEVLLLHHADMIACKIYGV